MDRPNSSIREDVWQASGTAYNAGLWEDAIFDAFRLMEDHLRNASGITAIGGALVNAVWDRNSGNARLAISTNPEDLDKLNALYNGALAFFKGDRSHKRDPAFPCPNAELCLRLMVVASALMDLIDLDLNTAPTIVNVHMESNEAIDLLVRNVGAEVAVLANGQSIPLTSKGGMCFEFVSSPWHSSSHCNFKPERASGQSTPTTMCLSRIPNPTRFKEWRKPVCPSSGTPGGPLQNM